MILGTAIVAALAFTAPVERARYAMGTTCEVAVGTRADAEAAFAEAKRIEGFLSTWTDGSELALVNRGERQPGPELRALLETAGDWSRRTGGAFDPRVRGLIDAWRTRADGALPTRDALDRAKQDTRIEEGGFGKGYAIDRMLAVIASPNAMIDFGGQLAVRGSLRVTIADPALRDHPVLALTLSDASLSTTSGSEKTFTAGGRTFCHIFDPRTGEPLPPRGSASVIAADALSADILSTALYVMGEDEALRWADANGVALIFITPNHTVRRSASARERTRDLELLDRKFELKD